MNKKNQADIYIEFYRKSIHLLGLIFPVLYHFSKNSTMIVLITALLVLSFIVDKIRVKFNLLEYNFFKKIGLSQIYRKHEQKSYSALTFAFIGMLICLLISSKPVFNLAISILILSDTNAAIIGKLFGKTKINGKSIEGSIAFFLTSCAISIFITFIYELNYKFLLTSFLASLLSTIVELYSNNSKLNDNMTIPISFIAIMTIFGY
jgi:dolichol kinase